MSAGDAKAERRHPGLNLGAGHGSADDEAENAVFGFWVFMASDLVLFGCMFVVYAASLGALAGGPGPKDLFDLRPAFVETLLLLTSSFTVGLALLSLKHEREHAPRTLAWLGVTLLLGLAFLGMEVRDFVSVAGEGGLPQASGWLSAFWGLVPLHFLHVSGACLWLLCIFLQIAVHGIDTPVKLALLRLGILWHFLDVVWIGIVSLVFLGGLA